MTAGLLVICPIRHRPHSLPPFLAAFRATAGPADLLLVMDEDDRTYDSLRDGTGIGLAPGETVVTYPRMPTGPKVNRAAAEHAQRYRAVMFMGDDNRPRTPGWDTKMMAALDDMGGGIVHANDLLRSDLPCSALMSTMIVRALGWMVLPGISHFYMDNVWGDLGKATGRLRYLPDVVIEHLHPCVGKAPSDALYEDARALYWDADEATYRAWRREQMGSDVETVRKALQ